jgi:hypothetical protein
MATIITYLKKANSNTDRISGAPQGTLIIRDWPWIAGKGLQDAGELELYLLDG